ncbi:hypothetical protein [Haloglycomyces albus]|uniref:hypothetical protein n=1 Tax=Haloglycomyces albus TaxID=526067 RepID=UPI00046CA981|nr:hypothetical protein [Haloglycomyces albus]
MDIIDDHVVVVGSVAGGALVIALCLAAFSATALGKVRASEKWPTAPAPPIGHNLAVTATVAGLLTASFAAGALSLVFLATGLGDNLRVLIALGAAMTVLILGAGGVSVIASRYEMRALVDIPEHRRPEPAPLPVSGEPTDFQRPDHISTPTDVSPEAYSPITGGNAGPSPVQSHVHATPPSQASEPQQQYFSQPQSFQPSPVTVSGAGNPLANAHTTSVPTIPTDTQPGWVFRDRSTGAYYAAVQQSRGGIGLLALADFTVARTASLVGPLDLIGSVETSVWPMERDGAMEE